MSDERRFEYRAFRWTRWGPAHVVVRGSTIEATVGESVVGLDLTDRRPALERQADEWRSVFTDGVPVSLGGAHVATITTAPGSPSGLVRRQHHRVTGEPGLVLPGMEFTNRGLPHLVTLRSDAGVLVASRRWATPVNVPVTEWSIVREHDLIPPRVTRAAGPQHIAFWLAMKEALST